MAQTVYKRIDFALLDGREVKLALTVGGVTRLKEHFKVDTLQALLGILETDPSKVGPFLYEALPKDLRGKMPLADFEDEMGADFPYLARVALAVFQVFQPEPEARPPEGEPPAPPAIQ